jgi:hypothetical protein
LIIPVECSKQKHTDLLIFRLGADLNEHILELFKIASALDIRLFIVQPQRIYKYLKEEGIELIEKSEFFSVIDRNFERNKIILGVLKSSFSGNKEVRRYQSGIRFNLILH